MIGARGRVRATARRLGMILAILPWALAPAAGRGDDRAAAPRDAVSEARLVEAALNSLTAMTALFTQTLESPALPSPQVERGVVYLQRPGRVRFEYEEPKGKLAIADGQRTYLYLPEERQVLVAPLGARGTRGGISLLLQERIDLVAEFAVAWGPEPPGGGARPLTLTPRVPRPEYQSLLLETDSDHLVTALTLVDPLGSRITYRFARLRRAAALDGALFRFAAPPGVSVREAER